MAFCISESEYLSNPDLYDVVSGPSNACGCAAGLTTSVGSNVPVESQVGNIMLSLSFSQVTFPGETYVSLVRQSGYETWVSLNSTASFSGPVVIGFKMPDEISEDEFNRLVVVRNTPEGSFGITADIQTYEDENTILRDYSTRTVYGVSPGFSVISVVLAQAGLPLAGKNIPKEPNQLVNKSCASYVSYVGLEWMFGNDCTNSGFECCTPCSNWDEVGKRCLEYDNVNEHCYKGICTNTQATADGKYRRSPTCACVPNGVDIFPA